MKSIFGKLSILCFIGAIIGLVMSYKVFMMLDDPMGMAMMAYYLPIMSITFGFLFCHISANKKEVPKCYRYIGFFLNCLWIPLLLYMSIFGQ